MKWASEDGAGVLEMLFFRGLVGAPIVLGWIMLNGGIADIRTRRPRAHLFRAVIGVGSLAMIFQGLILLPIADAVTIGFSAPAFATLLSALLLGEQVGRYRWLAVALGFLGVLIVTRPGGADLPAAGILFALLGAIGNGAVTVTIRQLGTSERPAVIAFWFLVAALAVGAIGMAFVATAHAPLTWALLVFAGVIGAGAQLLLTESLHRAPVSVVVPFDYVHIVWAALLGWLIWATVPGINTVIGAALIIASGLFTAWREHRLRRPGTAPLPVE